MLTLTTDATTAIEQLLENDTVPDGAGVRIAAAPQNDNGAGTAGTLQMTVTGEPEPEDMVIEEHGARVFVEDELSALLDDKVLDVAMEGDLIQFSLASQP